MREEDNHDDHVASGYIQMTVIMEFTALVCTNTCTLSTVRTHELC